MVWHPYIIQDLFSLVFIFCLGFFVYIKNPKSSINRIFFILSLLISAWVVANLTLENLTLLSRDPTFMYKMSIFFASLQAPTLILFAWYFPRQDREINRKKVAFVYGVAILFGLLAFSNFYLTTIEVVNHIRFINAGPLYKVFALYFCLFTGYSFFHLLGKYKHSVSVTEKNQITWVLLGLIVAYIVGVGFSLLLPCFLNYSNLEFIGSLGPLILTIFMAYAILKHRLMDIAIVIRKSLVYSILVGLFTGLYLILLFTLSQFFHVFTGYSSTFIAMFLLLLFALAFQPLKIYLQENIDRTFFKERYLLRSYLENLNKKIVGIVELTQLMDLTAHSLWNIFGAKYVEILLFDKKAQNYRLKSSYPREIFTYLHGDSFLIREMKKHQSILLRDDLDEKHNAFKELKELEAFAVIPLISKNQLFGLIVLGEYRSEMGEEELKLLGALSSQFSIAIENSLLIEEKLEDQKQLLQTDKLKSLGTIAAGMAHEIKNPLTVISGLAKIVKERHFEKDDEFFNDFDEMVPRQLDRIKKIAEGLSQYGKRAKSEKKLVNLNNILEEVIKLFESKCKKSGIKIEKNFNSLNLIEADPEQMQQVFTNLILNAIEAMEQGARELKIESRIVDGNKIAVYISDTGHGIPKDKLKDIFEPFYTTKEQGSGLGLSIVKKIVEEHGGRIYISSEEGKGTKSIVRF